jgi:murein DD-endopeptidase MepM/ murein hydrolase activator NlpD
MDIKLIVEPVVRYDKAGAGNFGASRGNRDHNGVDYLCRPKGKVFSPAKGTVTKHGYTYRNDPQWRYIEVTDENAQRHRLFYVSPKANVNQHVEAGEVIGEAQDISQRYPGQGMLAHVHYEIMTQSNEYLDPEA